MNKITGWYRVPKNQVSLSMLEKDLIIKPRSNSSGEKPDPIKLFHQTRRHYLVPVSYGLNKFGDAYPVNEFENFNEIINVKTLPDPNHPNAPEGQGKVIKDTLDCVNNNLYTLLKANTGTGKTVIASYILGSLKKRTLIIAPTIPLMLQWEDEIKDKLGVNKNQIGIIGNGREEVDKPIVIASLKSIWSKEFDIDFYNNFALIIYDELHVYAAQEMHKVLGKFSAPKHLGLTATPKRKDGRYKIIKLFFGDPKIEANIKSVETKVIPLIFNWSKKVFCADRNKLIWNIGRNSARTKAIMKRVLNSSIDNRNVLFISDSIKQLQFAEKLTQDYFSKERIGLFVDQYKDNTFSLSIPLTREITNEEKKYLKSQLHDRKLTFYKNKVIIKPFKNNQAINLFCGYWKDRTDYLNIDQRKRSDIKVKVSNERRNEIKKNSVINFIFATYGAAKFGLDIPRLDTLVDLTPRAEGEQLIGRIRRKLVNKKQTYFFTVIDMNLSNICENINNSRIRDLQSLEGVTIMKSKRLN